MTLIVQKYGGAVLSDIGKIRRIAEYIANLHSQGNQMLVVVSAMGYTTDELVRLANAVSANPSKREMDMLLSVGERITMSLLVMAIEATGLARAISFTGSQVGIITDNQHTEARIVEVRGERLKRALDAGQVVVVAGFQGVSLNREITTLGRGGSDTTAIALAAAIGADRCDLIKEVPGIFSGDPTIIPEATHIPAVEFDHIRELSLGGARIVKTDCIDLARRSNIELRIGDLEQSSLICESVESPYFSVSLKENLTFLQIPNKIGRSNFPGVECVAVGNEVFVFGENRRMRKIIESLPEDTASKIHKPVHALTAVGERAELAPGVMNNLPKVEIIFYHCSAQRVKIVFSGDNPQHVAREIHMRLRRTT